MTTTQATRISIHRNESTGYALTTMVDAYGVIHVTDTAGLHHTTVDPDNAATVVWERSLFHDARPHQAPAPTMASPLAPEHRVRPSNLGKGSSLTTMTEAQARAIRVATIGSGRLFRGPRVTTTMLRAMARRGWLELDDRVRPTYGTVTQAGRNALAAYDARNGGAR